MVDVPDVDTPDLPETPGLGDGDWVEILQTRWWAALPAMLLAWIAIAALLFPIVGLIVGGFSLALVVAPLLGLAAAAGLGLKFGLVEPVDEARQGAPLWVRLLLPIPVFAVLWLLFLPAIGSLVSNFALLVAANSLLALAVTAAGVWALGLFGDLPQRVRNTSPRTRLGMLTLAALIGGAVSFAGLVAATDLVPLALASVLPAILFLGVGLALLSGWDEDATAAIRGSHVGWRLGTLVVLEVLFTIYFALLLGPISSSAVLIYPLAIVLGLALLIPTAMWAHVSDDVRALVFGVEEDDEKFVRLGLVSLAGLVAGLAAFGGLIAGLENVTIGLAALVPVGALAAVGLTLLLDWTDDVRAAVAAPHYGFRFAGGLAVEVLLAVYVALLVGPLFSEVTFPYAIGAAVGLAVVVPGLTWIRAWQDAWDDFLSLEEMGRVVTVGLLFPIAAALFFLLIVVLTDSFAAASILAPPLGLFAALGLGAALGITQEIPIVVRKRGLPGRSAVFLAAFALLTLYAYFGIALVVQKIEIALVGGMGFAGLVLGALSYQFDLGEGMGEEFEEYGTPAEAGVLAGVFLVALVLAFLAIGLTTGDVRLAILVSVVVAAGVNYMIAHQTGLVDSARTIVDEVPWYADLAILGLVFVGSTLYGTLALGLFVTNPFISLAFGALVGLGAIVALSQDLALGEDVIEAADDQRSAQAVVLVLALMAGFVVGLSVTAAASSLAGEELFGFPLFVAIAAGAGTAIAVARYRGWEQELVGQIRSRTDKLKATVILATWLGIGILTGFAFTALPIGAADLGIGSSASLPLPLALAAGLVLWAWVPVLLFRATRVERTPVEATVETTDKTRALASTGWGLFVFGIALVVSLSLFSNPLLPVLASLAVGYVTALVISTRKTKSTDES